MRRPDAAPAAPSDRAVYRLSKPLRLKGTKRAEIYVIKMRGISSGDRELLDHHRGNLAALTRELIGTLCDLTAEQVATISRADYAMLSEDILWQLEEAALRFGLPQQFFIQAQGGKA